MKSIGVFTAFKRDRCGQLRIALLAAVAIYLFIPFVRNNINSAVSILKTVDVESAREYILSFGVLAPAVSFMLMVLQSLIAPLPAFILTFANAGLFGWVNGGTPSRTSAMAGAALCFFLARYLGRDFVEKLTSKSAVEKVDEFQGIREIHHSDMQAASLHVLRHSELCSGADFHGFLAVLSCNRRWPASRHYSLLVYWRDAYRLSKDIRNWPSDALCGHNACLHV